MKLEPPKLVKYMRSSELTHKKNLDELRTSTFFCSFLKSVEKNEWVRGRTKIDGAVEKTAKLE